jgi:hypothetical protein
MTKTRKRKPRPRHRETTSVRSIARSSRAVDPPTSAVEASLPQPQPASSPQKKLPIRKRVRIGDALRRKGLDEWTIADGYVDVVGKLTRKAESNDSVAKLLVDVLKECSRHLEPPRSADAATDAPVIVKLVHTVSRPKREPAPSS